MRVSSSVKVSKDEQKGAHSRFSRSLSIFIFRGIQPPHNGMGFDRSRPINHTTKGRTVMQMACYDVTMNYI